MSVNLPWRIELNITCTFNICVITSRMRASVMGQNFIFNSLILAHMIHGLESIAYWRLDLSRGAARNAYWVVIIYSAPNTNQSCIQMIEAWMSNYVPQITTDVITYQCKGDPMSHEPIDNEPRMSLQRAMRMKQKWQRYHFRYKQNPHYTGSYYSMNNIFSSKNISSEIS